MTTLKDSGMDVFETDFFHIAACEGEVHIQNVHLPTSMTEEPLVIDELIEALWCAKKVAFGGGA